MFLIFNKILLVKESQNLADLETYFGKPKTIELSTGDIAFDAYAYLKKRFKDYKWIETELPIRTDLDYAEEIHRVEIPELGITFEYDNQDPLRRPLSIFFK